MLRLRTAIVALFLGLAGTALLPSSKAEAWWGPRYGVFVGIPPVVVAPPPVYAPPPYPVYYPHRWIAAHWNRWGRWVPGHWA